MQCANKDKFLDLIDRRYHQFSVERLGPVRIQSLTEGERQRVVQKMIETNANAKVSDEIPWIIAASVVNENGERLFGDQDVPIINDMESGVIRAIYEEIDAFNQCKLEHEEERVEEAGKNLSEILVASSQ